MTSRHASAAPLFALLLLLYVAAYAPAVWMTRRGWLPQPVYLVVYAPVRWVAQNSPVAGAALESLHRRLP